MSSKRRRTLTKLQRQEVFDRTRGRCHICGGELSPGWVVDHVEPHATAGDDKLDNMLPAHSGCNRFRWFYEPETIQIMAELAVYAKAEIIKESPLGRKLEELYIKRANRRTTVEDPASRIQLLKDKG